MTTPLKSDPYTLVYLARSQEFVKFHKPLIAFAYYRNFSVNLLTLEKTGSNGHSDLKKRLANRKIDDVLDHPEIFHLTYEYGLLEKQFNFLSGDTLLGFYFHYEKASAWIPGQKASLGEIKNESFPNFSDYQSKFDKVQKHLERGDSYQVNLTMPFTRHYDFLPDPLALASSLWTNGKVGAFAHLTNIPSLNLCFFSNTPECLFDLKQRRMRTMPIKGTIRSNGPEAWKKLERSKKDQAELYMITDLLRHDFNSIGENGQVRVLAKKCPLEVSGLIHQYSLIEKTLDQNFSLDYVLEQIFPGGSITGAPKLRTMEIILDIEDRERGLYTGSTIVFHQNLKGSSLNIRSALINYSQKSVSYNAGGGITLLSNCKEEFDEMYAKWESFQNLL